MPLYKVWSHCYTVKKMVFADSLQDIKIKANDKLKLSTNHPENLQVLLNDGTEVDEDEILFELKDQPLIILKEGQQWMPENCGTISEMHDTVSVSDDSVTDNLHVFLSNTSTESASSEQPSCNSIQLPEFSTYVKASLRKKDSCTVWNKVIGELVDYYMAEHPTLLDNQTAYRLIGEKMYAMYPCIKREGSKPWSTLTHSLSQRMRTERLKRKVKSEDVEFSRVNKAATSHKVAKRDSVNHILPQGPTYLSESDYNTHIREMQKEYSRGLKCNDGHLKVLLKETFVNRRSWIQSLCGCGLKQVIDMFPCFVQGKYIVDDFRKILTDERFEMIGNNIEKIIKELLTLMTEKQKLSDGDELLTVLRFLYRQTAFSKGKGTKSREPWSILYNVPDTDVEKHLKTQKNSPPQLLMFYNNDNFEMAVVVGDGCEIATQGDSVLQALIVFMAVYYVMDLDYPRIYSQVLGFIQNFVVGDLYTGEKSKNYKHLVAKLQKSM